MSDAKSSGAKYRIQSLEDFLAVPEEEQEECLKQFGLWLSNVREMAKACNARARWMLKAYTDAERDEFIGGVTICVPKRFLYRSQHPREVAQHVGLPPPSAVKKKIAVPRRGR